MLQKMGLYHFEVTIYALMCTVRTLNAEPDISAMATQVDALGTADLAYKQFGKFLETFLISGSHP